MENVEQKKWCVYIHTNKINNKAYIGITSKKPEYRWKKDGSGYANNPAMKNAIEMYGWNNFEHIVFMDNLLEKDAKHIEMLLIAIFKTNCSRYYNPTYGYNLTDGGDGVHGFCPSEEQRKKIKENHADFNGGKHPRAKAVYCIELDKIFECMRDAQRELNINAKDIGDCCRGKRNTAGNYHWIYADDIEKNGVEEILNRKKNARITSKKRVRCKETGEIFDSITQASIKKNVDLSSISACCHGKLKQTKGLHWEFVE